MVLLIRNQQHQLGQLIQVVHLNQLLRTPVNLFDNTSNEWYLTGCQLEVGSVMTPFEHRSYGDELMTLPIL